MHPKLTNDSFLADLRLAFCSYVPVNKCGFYFFVVHHCANSLSSLQMFVHHCTLKQALDVAMDCPHLKLWGDLPPVPQVAASVYGTQLQ